MQEIVLRPNAIPVYGFLSTIRAREEREDAPPGGSILDCGAGGPVPPLALFHQQGFDAWGIDTSWEQVEKSRRFCQAHGVELNLGQADMRQIPFEDESFDYVYEQYAMCHLSKAGTGAAVREMHRVLRAGGLCLLGVISADTWPKSLFGEEQAPGEYWGEEGGENLVRHSVFADEEAGALTSGWEVVSKKKHIRYLRDAAEELSLEAWMTLREETDERVSSDAWREHYEHRKDMLRYVHLYYVLEKPG